MGKTPIVTLVMTALVLCSAPLASATEQWECIGPEGGSFVGSVADPSNPNHVISVTTYPSPSEVYSSMDGGASWSKIGQIPEMFLYGFSAFDMNRLYALAIYGVYCSTDGGVTWTYSAFPSGSGYGYCISADPVDPNKIHVGGYKYLSGSYQTKFFQSSDGGATWVVEKVANYYAIPRGIAISKMDPNTMYMVGYKQSGGSYGAAVFQSTNGGNRWYDISSSVETTPNLFLYSVAVDPTDNNKVYIAGANFYYSTDAGATWTKNSAYNFGGDAMGVDPANPNNIFIAGGTNAFVSNDAGQTWLGYFNVFGGYPSTLDVADPSTIYVASTYGGMFKSTNSGQTWVDANGGIAAVTIASLAVAPSKPETVFIDIAAASTLVATYDCGDTIQKVTYPNGCSGTISDLLVNSQDPDNVIALEAG